MKYIIFNKPYGVLSQFTTEEGHRTLSEFELPKGVYAAGRLDKDSEGLLLLTDDGPFIKMFLDRHERVYWAQVDKIASKEALEKLAKGVNLKDGKSKPCKVRAISKPDLPPRNPPVRYRKEIPTSWLELTLKEGKNRQVRRMTAAIGHPTLRLIRVGLGKFRLKNLEPGKWVEVKKEDII
ncbi:MAG: pseudouridine synthase [Epsilonproteobacteria bacterium]|nr:MAG: pseudouridine synthase [Campylobacterota bacterium]RLA65687.1 MAG: pseudouridine synthase [Campylobacterota bacterium]